MENRFLKTRVEFHILQSFPVTCLNRDDLGSPKTAIVGGVQRARISSQCWKRQVRMGLQEQGVKLAVRTKHLDAMIQKACLDKGATEEQAQKTGEMMAKCLTDNALIFVSEGEASAFADYAAEQGFFESKDGQKANVSEKELTKAMTKISKTVSTRSVDGLDIALFGRMVAASPQMNIEAAASFSHAISTHKASPEIEFFTALDDMPTEEEQGSSHMGSLEYTSATYYRYICLDLGQLAQTLGTEDSAVLDNEMKTAITAFIKALYTAVPSARQSTQSGVCGWDYARVLIRKGQPLQYACETPVKIANGGGYLESSIRALDEFLAAKERMSGSLFGKIGEAVLSAEQGSVDDVISKVLQSVGLGK
jgi:CRISPR system Cascade subunit CasC